VELLKDLCLTNNGRIGKKEARTSSKKSYSRNSRRNTEYYLGSTIETRRTSTANRRKTP
jgi:hypothetical protein